MELSLETAGQIPGAASIRIPIEHAKWLISENRRLRAELAEAEKMSKYAAVVVTRIMEDASNAYSLLTSPRRDPDLPIVDSTATRAAGDSRQCFYCHQPIGEPHSSVCVLVCKLVRFEVFLDDVSVGMWSVWEPWHWDEAMSNFHKNQGDEAMSNFDKNQGGWCAGNFLDHLERVEWKPGGKKKFDELVNRKKEEQGLDSDENPCLCEEVAFVFDCVIDGRAQIEPEQVASDPPQR